MTLIVDYGCGNPASIRNMLKKLGHAARISADSKDVLAAERIIFPGVGSFDYGASRLTELGLVPALTTAVLETGKPILGICIGAQLLCRRSEEGSLPGLGWIEADVVRFDQPRMTSGEKIPHMGWEEVEVRRGTPLLEGYLEPPRFYFAHSYHLSCDNDEDVAATARHGYSFAAAVVKGNIAGVQFHPEKSHVFGMALLDRFVTRFRARA
jgi:imidazole glycerol-phosphate synthase subunit HisH